mgnify:FL=1
MNLLGTLVNTGAVLLGGGIGLLAQKGLPKRLSDILFQALGLCTIYIGVSGALSGENTLILILCMVLGTLIGEGIDLDLRVNQLGGWIERRFSQKNQKGVSLAEGFVTASLLFCVGAMSIVGALQSGLSGSHEMLYTKSLLDFVSAIIFASTLGAGVLFSALFVLVYQGSITLLAAWVAPLLSDAAVAEMTCVGSVIIIGLGLNMIGVSKLKVMNFVPAIFLPMLFCLF